MRKSILLCLLIILLFILAWLFHWRTLIILGVLVWLILFCMINMLYDSENIQKSIEELHNKIQKLEKKE